MSEGLVGLLTCVVAVAQSQGCCRLFLYEPSLCVRAGKVESGLTVTVDDAGMGDLLFGVVIGAFRDETGEFHYDVIDVRFFQSRNFVRKEYLRQASRIVAELLGRFRLEGDELIHVCRGYIFDDAVADLKQTYGKDRVSRVKVEGEAQRLTELAYLDELRNLGYEPVVEREAKRAKSFFHMLQWLKENPDRLRYAKTGWPRLQRYRLVKSNRRTKQ